MELVIDKLGRVVVPKPVRERLMLHPGSRLRMRETERGIVLETTVEANEATIAADGLPVFAGALVGPVPDHRELRQRRVPSGK